MILQLFDEKIFERRADGRVAATGVGRLVGSRFRRGFATRLLLLLLLVLVLLLMLLLLRFAVGRRRVRAVTRLLGGQKTLDGRAQNLGVHHRTGRPVPHDHVAALGPRFFVHVRGLRRQRRRRRRRRLRRWLLLVMVVLLLLVVMLFRFARDWFEQRHLRPLVRERHHDRRLLHHVLAARADGRGAQLLFRALRVAAAGPRAARHRRGHRGRRPRGHLAEPVPGAVARGRGRRHGSGRAQVRHVHAVRPAGPEHVTATVHAARRQAVRGLTAARRPAARRLQRFAGRRLQRVHYGQQIRVGAHDPGRLGRRCRRVGRQLGRASTGRHGRCDLFAHVDVRVSPGLLEPETRVCPTCDIY